MLEIVLIALWPTVLEALRALGRHYGPEMERAAAGMNVPEWGVWLLPAKLFDPEPISAARLRLRAPYVSSRFYDERLAEAARRGFLAQVSGAENAYRLTDLGRQAVERLVAAVYAKMATLQPLPPPELKRLADLLLRLVEACLAAPEPPGKWCILHSRRTDPGHSAPLVVKIDQYLSDLAAYRDDSHLAAWCPYEIDGHAWEAFTYLWRGEAATLEELYRKLERRGYARDEYRQAMEDLIRRNWLTETAGTYQVTALGAEIRQAAEQTTDRYFYAPWSCLNQAERRSLQDLLTHLRENLAQ